MNIRIYIYDIHMPIHICTHRQLHIHTYTYIYTRIYICTNRYLHIYIHMHIDTHAYVHSYKYTHMHIHTYLHISKHTCLHVFSIACSLKLGRQLLVLSTSVVVNDACRRCNCLSRFLHNRIFRRVVVYPSAHTVRIAKAEQIVCLYLCLCMLLNFLSATC